MICVSVDGPVLSLGCLPSVSTLCQIPFIIFPLCIVDVKTQRRMTAAPAMCASSLPLRLLLHLSQRNGFVCVAETRSICRPCKSVWASHLGAGAQTNARSHEQRPLLPAGAETPYVTNSEIRGGGNTTAIYLFIFYFLYL